MDGFYSVPAGGVEKGETLREAACRELHEELGVSTRRDQLTLCHVLHCQTNGDTWTGYFFATLSWLGEASAQEIQKHSHYRWSTLEGIADQLVPYVKVALEGMLAGKSYSEYGWPIRPNMRGQ